MKRILYISLLLLLNAIAFPLAAQVSNTRDYITVRLIPALSEIAGSYHGRVAGWPQILKDPDEPARAEKAAVSAYYDVVNFARFVSQPCKLFIGYNDRTCCPTSTLSVWSVLGTKTKKSPAKELFVVQDCAHWQYPEHRQARHRWVLSAE